MIFLPFPISNHRFRRMWEDEEGVALGLYTGKRQLFFINPLQKKRFIAYIMPKIQTVFPVIM